MAGGGFPVRNEGKGEGGGEGGGGVGTSKATGKSMRTRLSKLPFSKLPLSFSPDQVLAALAPFVSKVLYEPGVLQRQVVDGAGTTPIPIK